MYMQVINLLPDAMVRDLPVEVRWALDDYLDDKRCMYHATERFLSGDDMLPGTYNPLITNLKARKTESLQALKKAVSEYCPSLDMSVRLSEIGRYLNDRN